MLVFLRLENNVHFTSSSPLEINAHSKILCSMFVYVLFYVNLYQDWFVVDG